MNKDLERKGVKEEGRISEGREGENEGGREGRRGEKKERE